MYGYKILILSAGLAGAALVLALSCRERPRMDPPFVVQVYSEGIAGFGYAVYQDGKKIVNQPNIPAVQHLLPFRTREEAERAGRLVSLKLQAHQFPPSVTIQELDSLRIRY